LQRFLKLAADAAAIEKYFLTVGRQTNSLSIGAMRPRLGPHQRWEAGSTTTHWPREPHHGYRNHYGPGVALGAVGAAAAIAGAATYGSGYYGNRNYYGGGPYYGNGGPYYGGGPYYR
jgi:hypothetical protein